MIITRPGCIPGNLYVYTFRADVNSDSTEIHLFLDEYYLARKRQILIDSPRWRRNDPDFSTLETVELPDDVLEEALNTITSSITVHYPKESENVV